MAWVSSLVAYNMPELVTFKVKILDKILTNSNTVKIIRIGTLIRQFVNLHQTLLRIVELFNKLYRLQQEKTLNKKRVRDVCEIFGQNNGRKGCQFTDLL